MFTIDALKVFVYFLMLFSLPISFILVVIDYFKPVGRYIPLALITLPIMAFLDRLYKKNQVGHEFGADEIVYFVVFVSPLFVYLYLIIKNFLRR